ncbi:uncharacterized protein isoform X3 [Rhodnius prolixus]|uniref:uncharacterized protein isoform X3 n=1 Tax=Rhodnius prolixus TaxID=13249 RepID=UPI003D18932E
MEESITRKVKNPSLLEEPDDIVSIKIPLHLQKELHCEPDVDLFPDKPWICVSLERILKDIEENAEKSVFFPYKRTLELQEGEVVVTYEYYTQETGGQHWVCVTNNGKKIIIDHLILLFEDAVKKVETEFIKEPKPWKSLGSEEEVEQLQPRNRRPLISSQYISKKDKRFGSPNFTVLEAGSTRFTYLDVPVDSYHEHYNYITAKAIDEAIQAVIPHNEVGVQASEGIPVNAATQFNAEIEAAEKKEQLEKMHIDYTAVLQLLKSSSTRIMETLQYNEAYDLGYDDYATLKMAKKLTSFESPSYAHKTTFACLQELRGHCVTSMAWHPNIQGILAASYGAILPFNYSKLDGDSDDDDYKVDEDAITEEPIDKAYQKRLEFEAKDHDKWLSDASKLFLEDAATDESDEEYELAKDTLDYVLQSKKIMKKELKLDYLDSKNVRVDSLCQGQELNYEDYTYQPDPDLNLAKGLKHLNLDEMVGFDIHPGPKKHKAASITEETSITSNRKAWKRELTISEDSACFSDSSKTKQVIGTEITGKADKVRPNKPIEDSFKIYKHKWNFGKQLLKEARRIHNKYHHIACKKKGSLPSFPKVGKYMPKLNLCIAQYYKCVGPYSRSKLTYEEMAERADKNLYRTFSTSSLPRILSKNIPYTKRSKQMKNGECFTDLDSDNLDEIYHDMVNTIKERHKEQTQSASIKTRYKLAERKDYPNYLSSESVLTEDENAYVEENEKMEVNLLPRHTVLIWNVKENSQPILALRSPQEVTKIQFCPHNGNYLAGGTTGGQLVFWNLTGIEFSPIGSNRIERDRDDKVPSEMKEKLDFERKHSWYRKPRNIKVLRWTAASSIDSFHRGRIVGLTWIHPEQRFVDGHFEVVRPEEEIFSTQIITSGGEGDIKFWDLTSNSGERFECPREKMFIDTSQCPRVVNEDTFEDLDSTWEPLFKVKVQFKEGLNIPISCIIFDYVRTQYQLVEEELSSDSTEPFFEFVREEEMTPMNNFAVAGTYGGHLFTITWEPSKNGEGEAIVLLSSPVHDGPVVSIEQNKLHSNLILSVGGHIFALWYVYNLDVPLKWLKYNDVTLTYGAWSIWRPSVLRIARSDGVLEIWDLWRSSEHPKLTIFPTTDKITTIVDPILPCEEPLLCVADTIGSIKLFKITAQFVGFLDEDKPKIVELIDRQIQRKIYLRKWDKDYRISKNVKDYEYEEIQDEIVPLRKLERISPTMDLDKLDDIHEQEKSARKSIKKEMDKECRRTYFRELYKWYVRRRGYECPWLEEKKKDIYRKEQEEIIGSIMAARNIDLNKLCEDMKPILKHEQQLKYRQNEIVYMQAQADIIFKRNIEHIKILNPAMVKLFITDVQPEVKTSDLQKAEEEVEILFGIDNHIYEEELKLLVKIFDIGPPPKYKDLEADALDFREWTNDRLLLANSKTRWLRQEVHTLFKENGYLCTDWLNRKNIYVTKKYQHRLSKLEELQKIYGPTYDPLWDLNQTVSKNSERKYKNIHEKESAFVKKLSKQEEEKTEEENGMVDDFLRALFLQKKKVYTSERKLYEDKHDKRSVSSWIDLERIVEGGDVLDMSFEFEHKRRQQRMEKLKEMSPTNFPEVDVQQQLGLEDSKTTISSKNTHLDESSEQYLDTGDDDEDKIADHDEELTPALKMLRRKLPKTKYSATYDKETELKIFKNEVEKFLNEVVKKTSENEIEPAIPTKAYSLLLKEEVQEKPEEQVEEEQLEEEQEEVVELGVQDEEFEEGEWEDEMDFYEEVEPEEVEGLTVETKKKKEKKEFQMEGDVWVAMGGEMIGKPEYCESIPTDTASPSDVTEQYFRSRSTSETSSPLECEAEFGEFEDLLDYYKTHPESRRYPNLLEDNKVHGQTGGINRLKDVRNLNKDGSFTSLLKEQVPEIIELEEVKDVLLEKKSHLLEEHDSSRTTIEKNEELDEEEADRLKEID